MPFGHALTPGEQDGILDGLDSVIGTASGTSLVLWLYDVIKGKWVPVILNATLDQVHDSSGIDDAVLEGLRRIAEQNRRLRDFNYAYVCVAVQRCTCSSFFGFFKRCNWETANHTWHRCVGSSGFSDCMTKTEIEAGELSNCLSTKIDEAEQSLRNSSGEP